ncbi:MAG: STAS domain-containing protein [Pseudobdellovibrionaceae bacterium]
MNVSVSQFKNWQVVSIEGRIDSFNYQIITQKILDCVSGENRFLAVDLSYTEFMNLPTLRFMTSTAELLAARGGELALIAPSDVLMRHLEIFAAPHQVRVYKSLPALEETEAHRFSGTDHDAI